MASVPTQDEDIAREVAEAAVRTRHTVAALGGAIRAAHVRTSPALARATQAEQNLYDRIEAEFGLLSSAGAGERMGSRSTATRNLALAAQRDGRLLALRRGRYQVFPGFQFEGRGARPVIADLVTLGRELDRSETGLIQWLMSPTTYLQGRRPVDVIDDPEQLLEVAGQSFSVRW